MGTILWDFDGTLATRPGLWSQAMVDLLDEQDPGHGLTRDDFRPTLKGRFPWGRPDVPHPHLGDPGAWWADVGGLIREAFESAGYDRGAAIDLTSCFRDHFLHPDAWVVYDDTVETLTRLSAQGWRHVIVSNHVPELPRLVADLGLADHFDAIHSSALVGYEKPHPHIFRIAVTDLPPGPVVMVGDNPVADVEGARAVGIDAFLVRRPEVPDSLPDLRALVPVLVGHADV